MPYEFKMIRRVEFAETDMAGILHFANYYRFMEEIEHAFFRSMGLKVHAHDEDGVWGWVRGHAACTFKKPLRYEEEVELHLLVREKRPKRITYEIVFNSADPASGDRLEAARGSVTAICVARGQNGELRSMEMPADVDALIEEAPRELVAGERGGGS